MPAIRDLHGGGRALAGALRVEAATIPADNFHAGMGPQPGGDALGGAVGEEVDEAVDEAVPLQVT